MHGWAPDETIDMALWQEATQPKPKVIKLEQDKAAMSAMQARIADYRANGWAPDESIDMALWAAAAEPPSHNSLEGSSYLFLVVYVLRSVSISSVF